MSAGQERPIYVTEPYLPPLEQFTPYLQQIWDSKILTIGGRWHQQLEAALADYLGVPYVALFNNGTNALLTALQVLELRGEVITTPYSFAATAHSLLWNQLTPVFADVDAATFNIDPMRIAAAIGPRTAAIMPVHCYGIPCNVSAIAALAARSGLRVVYDAAHAFSVKVGGESLLRHGDLAVLSFHATKVFNTFEGGAIVCSDMQAKRRIDQLKNFGIVDEATIDQAGLNGKMSEVQAAFGLLQLEHIADALARRRAIDRRYRDLLAGICGIRLTALPAATEPNCAYFPILVEPDFACSRDELWQWLQQRNIFARRYFFPLLSELPMYSALVSAAPENLPNATLLARQVLCLPIHPGLSDQDVERVVRAVRDCRGKR